MAIDIPERVRKYVRSQFPDLIEGVSLEYTSPVDFNYDCLAWALGSNQLPFWKEKGGFWPWPEIPDDTADGWAQFCVKHGFVQTQGSDFVVGFEKIVIMRNDENDLHAARSDRNGRWKSKLGCWGPDIDHDGLAGLEKAYGKVVKVLQRHRPDWIP
ncbi:MAG: hypothetical protein WAM71_02930 [Candidatus Korobacteraceae bacterium]